MPPRSYFLSPRPSDYVAYAEAHFPNEKLNVLKFGNRTGLPYIATVDHLAAYIGVSPSLIRQIFHKKDYHYREFSIKQKNKKDRLIQTPKTYLKVIQWWILDHILNIKLPTDASHGFQKGRSYITNATAHLGSNHLLNIDIKNFFPSINSDQVLSSYQDLGYSETGASLLTSLTTYKGSVPTGAPTSPGIANLIFSPIDKKIISMCSRNNIKYTRYADDLTFSSQNFINGDFLIKISKLINNSGFQLNKNKTTYAGKGDRMEVTGIIINDKINIAREKRNLFRAILHNAIQDPQKYALNPEEVYGINGILCAIDPNKNLSISRLCQQAVEAMNKQREITHRDLLTQDQPSHISLDIERREDIQKVPKK